MDYSPSTLIITFSCSIATPYQLLAIVVLCSAQIERQLSLLLQLQKLHIPCVLALNMHDEAKKMGITIDAVLLEKKLKTPVIKTSAKYGEGMVELLKACTQV